MTDRVITTWTEALDDVLDCVPPERYANRRDVTDKKCYLKSTFEAVTETLPKQDTFVGVTRIKCERCRRQLAEGEPVCRALWRCRAGSRNACRICRRTMWPR